MKIKGADFLRGRKLDRELERVINNLFGYNYKVEFVENINEENVKSNNDYEKKENITIKIAETEKKVIVEIPNPISGIDDSFNLSQYDSLGYS